MKIKEFTYTKANGDVSKRTLIVTREPRTNIAGIDVTALDFEDYASFIVEVDILLCKQFDEMKELTAKYDLTHNYRQFTPANMSDVTTETF